MGAAKWVELFTTLTRGMGEPTYGLLLSLVASWWGLVIDPAQLH